MDHSSGQRERKKSHLMKSSWNFGKTVTIRIPLAIKEQLLAIARHIDSNGKIVLSDKQVESSTRNTENSQAILLQDASINKELDIPFSDNPKNVESILSQDALDEVIKILRHGITSKKQGGVYNSSNASTLKKEVIKALEILSTS